MWQRLPVERVKPAVIYLIAILFTFSLMSFTFDGKLLPPGKGTGNDSASSSKGFKSLFNDYDPSSSYVFQLNPKAVLFVEQYIKKNEEELDKLKVWGKPYFEIYDRILRANDLPIELKYLSVIESHLRSGLVSSAGAVGPWQLMPDEAKRFGLRTGRKDQRKDFELSTKVASKLLHELYNEFDDWLLVIAAYNCGSGRLRQAIKKAGTRDFWELEVYLPLQTRNHVKKFIATHYLMEGGGGWTTMTAKETDAHKSAIAKLFQTVSKQAITSVAGGLETLEINGRYNSVITAQAVSMDLNSFNSLNPNMDKLLEEGQQVELKLPAANMLLFKKKRPQILKESVEQLLAPPIAIQ